MKESPALGNKNQQKDKRIPQPNDILTIHLRIPRYYYDSLSRFAAYLAKTPMLNPQTGEAEKDPKTGQVLMSMQAPDIQTYLLTCGIRTQEAFMMVQQMQMAQQQQQQQQQLQQQQQKR